MFIENIDRKPTKAERVAEAEMEACLRRVSLHRMEIEVDTQKLYHDNFPKGWYSMEDRFPERPKTTRITARFDEDVVKFFKRSGAGYQAKMNEVLRMYMFARVAKYVEANGDRNRHNELF